MAERRHGAPFDDPHAAMPRRPLREPLPAGIPAASRAGGQAARAARSNAERSPASAPRWLTSTISPPGRSTRANSSSVASGSGTAVMTYCATTTSKEASSKPDAARPSPRAPRHCSAHARARAPSPCAASASTDRRRPRGSSSGIRAARCRCRRRLQECVRRSARPRRSRPCGRARTPRRTRNRRSAPSAHRLWRRRPCRVQPPSLPPAAAPCRDHYAVTAPPPGRRRARPSPRPRRSCRR